MRQNFYLRRPLINKFVRQSLMEAQNDYDPRLTYTDFRAFINQNKNGFWWIGFASKVPVDADGLASISALRGEPVKELYYVRRGKVAGGGRDRIGHYLDVQQDLANGFKNAQIFRQSGMGQAYQDAMKEYLMNHNLGATGRAELGVDEIPLPDKKQFQLSPEQKFEYGETPTGYGSFIDAEGNEGIRFLGKLTKESAFYVLLFEDDTAESVGGNKEMIQLVRSLKQKGLQQAQQTEDETLKNSWASIEDLQMLENLLDDLQVEEEGMINVSKGADKNKGKDKDAERERYDIGNGAQSAIDYWIRKAWQSNLATHTAMKDYNGDRSELTNADEEKEKRYVKSPEGMTDVWKTDGYKYWHPQKEVEGPVVRRDANGQPIYNENGQLQYEKQPIPFDVWEEEDEDGNVKQFNCYINPETGMPYENDAPHKAGDWNDASDAKLQGYIDEIQTALLKNIAFLSMGDVGPTRFNSTFYGIGGLPRSVLSIASAHLKGRHNDVQTVRDYVEYALEDTGFNDWEAENFAIGDDGSWSEYEDEANAQAEGYKQVNRKDENGNVVLDKNGNPVKDWVSKSGRDAIIDANTRKEKAWTNPLTDKKMKKRKNGLSYAKEMGDYLTIDNDRTTAPERPAPQGAMFRATQEARIRQGQMLREQRNRLYLQSLVRENLNKVLRGGRRLF